MALQEMKTVTITDKGQISIPKEMRKKSFKVGSKIAVVVYNDRIELRPLRQIGKAMETAYASEKVLGKEWNTKEEDAAWKNL